ncbi:hypothetical protein [Corynebacterium sp. P8-C1]|uniref:hypothetical protein n=1 Tax=Corynebacterium sp. P8-C1 TaxID=3059082 RepID=UPI00265D07E2|nr:hypothetical protein [Corynebacterium sp. P8-C1]WKK63639.1 hypothetical protein QYR04_01645 [Corynebacterium sp. P8-C1]
MTDKTPNPNDPHNLPKEAADRLGHGDRVSDKFDDARTQAHDKLSDARTHAHDKLNETRVNEERITPADNDATRSTREVRTDSRPATTGGSTVAEENNGGSGWWKWLLGLLALILLGLLIWSLVKGGDGESTEGSTEVTGTTTIDVTTTAPAEGGAAEGAGDAAGNAGDAVGDAAGQATDAVGDAAGQAGDAIGNATN